MTTQDNYQLVDSGGGEKLERCGKYLIRRPSSLCIWTKRLSESHWSEVHARYVPKQGWQCKVQKEIIEKEIINLHGVQLPLRLQDNGQIGFFPEHSSYLDFVAEKLAGRKDPQVLNLFAYTGLASIFSVQSGAVITHVDNSKKVLDWASETAKLNQCRQDSLRFIKEDAPLFVEREIKRGKQYDLVIADPPSFSRLGDRDTWELGNILAQFCIQLLQLVSAKQGSVFFANHHYETGDQVSANLFFDAAQSLKLSALSVSNQALKIPEENSPRALPAGFLTIASL